MKIDLDIIEMDFLLKLVRDRQLEIWKENLLPFIRDSVSIMNIAETFREITQKRYPEGHVPRDDMECCCTICSKLVDISEQIKQELTT